MKASDFLDEVAPTAAAFLDEPDLPSASAFLDEPEPDPDQPTMGDPRIHQSRLVEPDEADPEYQAQLNANRGLASIWQGVRNSRVGQAIFGRNAEADAALRAQAGVQEAVPNKLAESGLVGAMVAPFSGTIPRVPQQEGSLAQVAGGVVNAGSGLVEGLVSPVAMLGMGLSAGQGLVAGIPVAERVGAGLFAGDMLGHAPGQLATAMEAAGAGDIQGAVEGGLGTVASGVFGRATAAHALGVNPRGALRSIREMQMGDKAETLKYEIDQATRGWRGQPSEFEANRRWVGSNAKMRARPPGVVEYVPAADIPAQAPAVESAAAKATAPVDVLAVPATVEASAGVRLPETITGSNEGKASEMPAEGVEPLGAEQRGPAAPATERAPELSGAPLFGAPESVADQRARLDAEAATKAKAAARQELIDRAKAPLKGGSIDTTGDLLDPSAADNPLFAPRPARDASRTVGQAAEEWQAHIMGKYGPDAPVESAPPPAPTVEADVAARTAAETQAHRAKGLAGRTPAEDAELNRLRVKEANLDPDKSLGKKDQKRLAELEAKDNSNPNPAPAVEPPAAPETAGIPELPGVLVEALAKEYAPDVMRAHTHFHFGETEAAAVPSSKPGPLDLEVLAKGKARAAEMGWDWEAVKEKARAQAGLDADWLKPESREAGMLAALRVSAAKLAKQRALTEQARASAEGEAAQSAALSEAWKKFQERSSMLETAADRFSRAELDRGGFRHGMGEWANAEMELAAAEKAAGRTIPEAAALRKKAKALIEEAAKPLAARDQRLDASELMTRKSQELEKLLRAAGFEEGDGVSGAGIRLVKKLAKSAGTPDWPNTSTPAHYDALIKAVSDHLGGANKMAPPPGEKTPGEVSRQKRAARRAYADRPWSMIDMLKTGSKLSMQEVVAAHPDWAPSSGLRKFFTTKGGRKWDEFAEEALNTGALMEPVKTPQDLVEALESQWQQWKEFGKAEGRQVAAAKQEVQQMRQWKDKVLDGKRPKGEALPEVIGLDSLHKGDSFTVQGEKVTARAVEADEDGRVISARLVDGPKFGEHVVQASETQALHIDAGSLKASERRAPSASSEDAFSIGTYASGHPVALGRVDALRPVQSPELVRLANELGVEVRAQALRREGAAGVFRGAGGEGRIEISPDLFALENVHQLAAVLAHEIGHMVDWLPNHSLEKGNILGRVMSSLHRFLSTTMPRNPLQDMSTILTARDRANLRNAVARGLGPRPPETDVAGLTAWRRALADGYADAVIREIRTRGLITEADVHTELWNLSQMWRPLGGPVSDAHLAYRMSSRELYADALSVLMNNPGLLEARAPEFYKLFFDWLTRKPEVRDQYFELQELLSRGEAAVAQSRRDRTRSGYREASEELRALLAQEQDAVAHPHGFRTRLMQEAVDRGFWLGREVDRLRAEGHRISPDIDPRLAWEEANWASAEHGLTADRVHREVVGPLTEAGLNMDTLGELLQYERISGGMGARAILQMRLGDLGPELYGEAKRLAQDMVERMARGEAHADILARLYREGHPWDLIDEIRQNLLDAGTRSDLANPAAESPESVQAVLRSLERSMTPAQWTALRATAEAFRQIVYEKMAEGVEHGIINRFTFDSTITANRSWYATFRGLEHIEDRVTPFIRQARGSVGRVENPFITTTLKLMSVNNVMLRNRAMRLTRDLMGTHAPESFRPAEMVHNGVSRIPLAPARGLVRLELHENGIRQFYDVDPYIGAAFEQLTPANVSLLLKTGDAFFKGIYPLIIKYNPAFQLLTNPVRDFRRTARNLRAVTGQGGKVALAKQYVKNYRAAVDFADGNIGNPVVRAMMEAKALGLPMEGFGQSSGASLGGEAAFQEIMERYRVMTPLERSRWRRVAMVVPHWIQRQGAIFESLAKISAFRTMVESGAGMERGMVGPGQPRAAAATVRRYMGTPDFNIKGSHGAIHNSMVPFLNIFLQGYRGDLHLATRPTTRGGWWMQYLLTNGSKAMLMGLAAAGIFGDKVKEAYGGVSEYDKTNYDIVPVGYQDGGEHGHKVMYMRVPRDEASRVLSGAVYKLTRLMADAAMGEKVSPGRVANDLWAGVAGVVPSPQPLIDLAGAWSDYLRGLSPVDGFRNRPIVPDREMAAGGLASLVPMLKWSLSKTGVLNVLGYVPEADTTLEATVGTLPVVKGLWKVSDYGYRESEAAVDRERVAGRAQARMQYSERVRFMLAEHDRIAKVPERDRTPEQSQRLARLHIWYTDYRQADEQMIEHADAGRRDAARAVVERVNLMGEAVKASLDEERRTGFKFKSLLNP